MGDRPYLTMREAAAACDVSLSTIRRRREAGDFPDAVLDSRRGWTIPVDNLLSAGLRVNAPSAPMSDPVDDQAVSEVGNPERVRLLLELEAERSARRLAEAEARHLRQVVEMQREGIQDFRLALRALTAGASDPERVRVPAQGEGHEHPQGDPVSEGPSEVVGEGERPRRRWWRRA